MPDYDQEIRTEVITIKATEVSRTPNTNKAYLKVTDHLDRDLSLYDTKQWGLAQAGEGKNFRCKVKGGLSQYPKLEQLIEETTDPVSTPAEEAAQESGGGGKRSSGGGGGSGAKDRSIERQVALKETGDTVRLLLTMRTDEAPTPADVRRMVIEVYPAFALCVHGQKATPEQMRAFVKDAQQTLDATVEDYGDF